MMSVNKDNEQEMFPIVDEQGNIIGAATRGECHNGSRLHGKTSNPASGIRPWEATWIWAKT